MIDMAMGYRATQLKDALVIHDVPIFCNCKRGENEFDSAWVKAAVDFGMQRQAEAYFPPMHVVHHGPEKAPIAVGHFKITGMSTIVLKGERRVAIMCDLVVNNPEYFEEIGSGRFPYRSVEIFNIEASPRIDSLALLDHEAPFLELPMLMVSQVDNKTSASVQDWTFSTESTLSSTPAVGFFQHGRTAQLLFSQEKFNMAEKETPPEEIKEPQGALFGEGEEPEKKKDDDKGEEMEGEGGLDVSAVVKAIESGEISVADMDAILAAIQAQGGEPEEEAPAEPAPAAVPGAESMQMAALQGELEALKAKDAQRDEAEVQRADVGEAMQRLEGRPLGSDLEEKLTAFRKEHGAPAFAAYVDSMAKTFGAISDDGGAAAAFAGQGGKVPDVAMQYQDKGSEAVERAAQFCAEWEQLSETGHARWTKEAYVASNMKRGA